LAIGNLGKVKELIKKAELLKKSIDLYMFGANVTLKLEQYKDCADFCKKALLLDSKFKQARDLMQQAL
jgi:hypothetical protein